MLFRIFKKCEFEFMEPILTYFKTIPSTHRTLLLVGGITFFWLLESAIPLFKFQYHKWRHALPNLFFTWTTIVVNFGLAFILFATANWIQVHDFGMLNWFNIQPLWLYVVLGILGLDLISAYLAHFIEHKVIVLWMIHLVHHTDHKVDTTTANRHHPLESVIRFVFTTLGVLIVGAPMELVMLYQALSLVFAQFTHANISLPHRLDKVLSYVIISPDMHKIHHHNLLPYTDSNYGNIFSIWDRLFGTYLYLHPKDIVYGVDTYPDEKTNSNIKDLLKQPFQGYKKPTNI